MPYDIDTSRRLFSSDKFGESAVRNVFRSNNPGARDEAVARSVFHYDRAVREGSGVRYLELEPSGCGMFYRTMESGFEPSLKTYAQFCETESDAVKLADICNRVRGCVSAGRPGFLSEVFKSDLPESFKTEAEAANKARLLSYAQVISGAMSDVYFEVAKRSPKVLGTVVNNLDDYTWNAMYTGVQSRIERDRSPKSLALSDEFLRRHKNPDPNFKGAHFTNTEMACEQYYNWSFTDARYYNQCDSKYLEAVGIRDTLPSDGLKRCATHSGLDDRSMKSMVARQELQVSPETVPDTYRDDINRRYESAVVSFVREYCRKNNIKDADFDAMSGDAAGSTMSIVELARGCSDGAGRAGAEFPVIADICSDVYRRRAEIVDSVVDKSGLASGVMDNLRDYCMDRFSSYVLTHAAISFDTFSRSGEDAAGHFVNRLSDDLYDDLRGRRAEVGSMFPRDGIVDYTPVEERTVVEVMDEEGLASNRVPNNGRTKALLASGDYREMLEQCLYRYAYMARCGDNEMSAFIERDLSGKAPNETFRHIAANCSSIEDAKMLAHVVNLSCMGRDDAGLSSLARGMDSLIRDDLEFVLCDRDGFPDEKFRGAFCESLSGETVKKLDLAEFASDSQKKLFGKNPVEHFDEKAIFSERRSLEKWVSRSTMKESVKKSVAEAKSWVDEFNEFSPNIFCEPGKLATVLCDEYAHGRGNTNMHTVMMAGGDAEGMRKAARVCNLAFNALENRDSVISPFMDVPDDAVERARGLMLEDVQTGFNALDGTQCSKFVSELVPPARDEVISVLPGVWQNGMRLNIPREAALAPGYASALGVYNCPDFSGLNSDPHVVQPVFVPVQNNQGRGEFIRDTLRLAGRDEGLSSVDAQHKLTMSCVSTYRDYGGMVLAEMDGRPFVSNMKAPTYSLYELAEQCRHASTGSGDRDLSVFSKAYRSVVDCIPDDDTPESRGMRYAVKVDVARSMKFLNKAGLDAQFIDDMTRSSKYGVIVSEALREMPAYMNADADKVAGRHRPKSVRDIQESLTTRECICTGLMHLGQTEKAAEVAAMFDKFEAEQKESRKASKESERKMSDLEAATNSMNDGSGGGPAGGCDFE